MNRAAAWVLLTVAAACRAQPIDPAQRWPAGTALEPRERVLDGTRVRYVDTGRGPAVVLIHGFGASMYSWRHTIGPVADAGFRVVAYDNRGFGFSARADTGYTNASYARLAVALLDSLGVGDAVLVGHSMGGAIAAEVALRHPERVRALVLIGSAGAGVRQPALLRLARWPLVGPLVTGLRGRAATAALLRSTYAQPARVSEADVDQYYAPVADAAYGRALRGVLRAFRFDTLGGRLGTLSVPVLAIWGEHDRWIPPALGRRLAGDLLRVAFLIVPDAGHSVQEEQPAAVNQALVAFLRTGLPRIPEDLAWSSPSSRHSRSSSSPSTPRTPPRSAR